MHANSLMIVDRDGAVTVTRLAVDFELDLRVGELIPDGEGGFWHVEEVEVEQRHLIVSIVESWPAVELVDLLAA